MKAILEGIPLNPESLIFDNEIEKEYFIWMYGLVLGPYYESKYHKLFYALYSRPYIPRVRMDDNAACYGVDFRKEFCYRNGYPESYAELHINKPCSMLEMLISVAYKMEHEVMTNTKYGDRTGLWFWTMISTLEIGKNTDDNYDPTDVDYKVNRYLIGNYEPNGVHGLFIVNNCPYDLRELDVWAQFNWHINENFYKETHLC